MAALSRAALLCAALVSTSCFSPSDGVEPPLSRIYYPVGLALNVPDTRWRPLTRNPTHLYVANSNFDLQFNGGTLQSYDLTRVRGRICNSDADCSGKCGNATSCVCASAADPLAPPWCVSAAPCGDFGTKRSAQLKNVPGTCGFIDPVNPQDGGESLVVDSVEIGAFATDLIYRERPGAPAGEGRLFAPVRGDATLHWLDVNPDGVLECGQNGNGQECDDFHRSGDDPEEENTRGQRLPTEPYGIDATEDGESILVTHQTEGKVSLFKHGLANDASEFSGAPRLEFVQEGLPSRPIGIVAVPRPRAADANYEQAFLVTYRNASQVDQLRLTNEFGTVSPPRSFLYPSGAARIAVNSLGYDSRGIALDTSERVACEAGCGENVTCLQGCATKQLGVYIANRTPETLLIGKTNTVQNQAASSDLPVFSDSMDLSVGPSRVVVGQIIDAQGKLATRVFVVCFDSRLIFGYDPASGRIDTRIFTGRGPHSLVIDADREHTAPEYALGYVGHFTDSYIGVIDLDQRRRSYGTIVMNLGRPQEPRAQK
ncbi:MAG TPA: hypothetical protein VK524_11330 [Polyangiaceae bacterium]|nr:hypothetical protein [Polyangiaceae bacterium]